MLNIGEFARLGQVSPRMLRHYDSLGLLVPEWVDPNSGYRSYGVGQLTRLHRLLALRDLGFSLEQIGELLDGEVTVEQLRELLLSRRAELQQTIAEERRRLRRVGAHLRAIEGSRTMQTREVVIKHSQPLRIAERTGVAAGFGPDNIGPLFAELAPELEASIEAAGIEPGILVGYYDEPQEDGSVTVHVAFEIGDQSVAAGGDGFEVVELPVVEMAALVHHGDVDGLPGAYEALYSWVADSGHRPAGYGRELYHELDGERASVTELQLEISR